MAKPKIDKTLSLEQYHHKLLIEVDEDQSPTTTRPAWCQHLYWKIQKKAARIGWTWEQENPKLANKKSLQSVARKVENSS